VPEPPAAILEPVLAVVAVLCVLFAIALIVLVLMHSGRDTGFGGMGYTPFSHGGQHIVERNLTRLTVVVALAFVGTTIGLYYLL
jgi:preprotein translocase subunit SecG